jgi:hypothetical protein
MVREPFRFVGDGRPAAIIAAIIVAIAVGIPLAIHDAPRHLRNPLASRRAH